METAGLYAVVLVLLAILLCVALFAERNDYGSILRTGESIGSNGAEQVVHYEKYSENACEADIP